MQKTLDMHFYINKKGEKPFSLKIFGQKTQDADFKSVHKMAASNCSFVSLLSTAIGLLKWRECITAVIQIYKHDTKAHTAL